jgi:methionyl-tRNA formyltransferase
MKLGFVTCVQLGFSCMEAIYNAGGKLQVAMTLKDEKSKNK